MGSVFTDEVGKLSWVMQVSPKCSHMYPCKREEDFIGKEDVEVESQERAEDAGGEDWSEVATAQNTGSHEKLEEARHGFSPRASEGS